MYRLYVKLSAILAITSLASGSIIDVRQSTANDTSYLQEVCFPPTTDPIPPCQSIINIQTACEPNGTTPLALQAHAQCMCSGSFFSDWIGCLDCNYIHGARSPALVSAFNTIITSASNILCTGTPTASFAAIFSGLSVDSGVDEGGNSGGGNGSETVLSDRFPGRTDVSLYFTASGSQGPGVITGSATAAVATGSVTRVTGTGTRGGVSTTSSSSSGAQETDSVTSAGNEGTSSSTGGAAPTGVWLGALGAVAGGVVMAAL